MAKRTFIEEARREQIVAAAIETLTEIGYVKASLAQIAKRAGISTSLIPYHFKDKDDLMNQTLTDISATWAQHVEEELAKGTTVAEKLRIYIESNLDYMGARPNHFAALTEITFNARTADGVPLYQVENIGIDASLNQLEALLTEGQQNGEFRQFDVRSMSIAIRGVIDEFLGSRRARPGLKVETFTAEMVELFERATRKAK
jgi:AcrR family transcriptional regulator